MYECVYECVCVCVCVCVCIHIKTMFIIICKISHLFVAPITKMFSSESVLAPSCVENKSKE